MIPAQEAFPGPGVGKFCRSSGTTVGFRDLSGLPGLVFKGLGRKDWGSMMWFRAWCLQRSLIQAILPRRLVTA